MKFTRAVEVNWNEWALPLAIGAYKSKYIQEVQLRLELIVLCFGFSFEVAYNPINWKGSTKLLLLLIGVLLFMAGLILVLAHNPVETPLTSILAVKLTGFFLISVSIWLFKLTLKP